MKEIIVGIIDDFIEFNEWEASVISVLLACLVYVMIMGLFCFFIADCAELDYHSILDHL